MGEYTVPKDMARVRLCSPPLEEGEYTLFLSSAAASHSGHETVSDLLNSTTEFLSALDPSGNFCVLNRRQILWVQVLYAELAEDYFLSFKDAAQRVASTLVLANGNRLDGELIALTPRSSQRIVDMLNEGACFHHFESDQDIYLVNLDNVVVALPKEETCPPSTS